jgi:hypothetical protein
MSSRFAFLNHTTRLEAWALQKLTFAEAYGHTRMRRESFHRRLFAVSLFLVSAIAACTSLLVSQTASFKKANEVCKERFAIAIPKLTSFQEEFWHNASVSELAPSMSVVRITDLNLLFNFSLAEFDPPPFLPVSPLPHPQSNPDELGIACHGFGRATDLAFLQSPSMCKTRPYQKDCAG